MSEKYLRIGTNYYKKSVKPNLDGSLKKVILPWTRQAILDDENKECLKNINKYEGFVVQPSHDNYTQIIHKFYNKYYPLNHDLNIEFKEGSIENILKFLQHIFGEQINFGLDYLTIIWRYPTQILPVLCLVNVERNTGKTTFLNFLKLIFQDNMTINKNEDFKSRFNSDWTEKVIIGGEEIFLNKKEDAERIKDISTAKTTKTEAKNKDKIETPYFGKLVFCSNNETNFVYTDDKEIRYWIRKVPIINEEDHDDDLEDKMKKEIPQFVAFLNTRTILTPKRGRMWFTKQQIHTKALEKLITGTKANLEKELLCTIEDKLIDFEIDEIKFTLAELQNLIKDSFYKTRKYQIKEILTDKWKLESDNTSYKSYYKTLIPGSEIWQVESTTEKGRCYVLTKEFINKMLNC